MCVGLNLRNSVEPDAMATASQARACNSMMQVTGCAVGATRIAARSRHCRVC